MSSTVLSSSNFQSIFDAALADYLNQTGVDLTKNPLTEKLENCQSADAILELLQHKASQFKEYRNGNRKLINCLNPVVQVLHSFSVVLGGVASLVPSQPTNLIFSGIDILFGAAIAVGTSYDALVDLFECVANFLGRLHIYTEIPITQTMSGILITIMVEVLSVLALATKQIKQGRFKKFARKLLGESEIEAVIQRLDRLTDDEARMTASQTLQVVHGLVNNVKVVMDEGKASTSDIRQSLVTMQEMTNEINRIKRDQLQRDIRSWLSPPDPSTNHNIVYDTHRSGSGTWFTQGTTFDEWKSTGSLLWIHGKPGSGKSVLCSSIIQQVKEKCDSGLALIGYYYFDFRDTAKQDVRGLLASLIAQLCAKSDSCHDILSELFSKNDAGSQQPNNHALTECLKKMIQLPRQPIIYIIVDALDECPNTGFPSTAREKVLDLFEDLLESNLPNLRICVTSRPEVDIRDVLGPLTSHYISLHDESGQKSNILEYISYVLMTDRKMRKWRSEDKELVINTLSAKADGMFRWVVCQLDMLRRCFSPSLRDALKELPETLDETYKRILSEIDREKREYAHRLLQCVAVAIRPLRVQELAEVLAMRFDSGEIPHYHVDWRQADSREAVLSACSSLVAIVDVDSSSIVQFSHFSVKEYLTSHRFAETPANLSRYHIDSLSAHTILAQASLGILLHLDNSIDRKTIEDFPFSIYAGQHWVDHGRFEGVSPRIQNAMERLFDGDNPSFATWLWIYDIDYPLKEHMFTPHPTRPEADALYYATLCGFRDVVEHLLATRPGDINARGGNYTTPLHAALEKDNLKIAALLLEHDADAAAFDDFGYPALHIASREGHCDKVKFLLEHHADVNMVDRNGTTALGCASFTGELEIVGILLGHGAPVNSGDDDGWTPLLNAACNGHNDVVQLLIQSGAAVDSRDNDGWTPLYAASNYGHRNVMQLLIQSGAAVDSCDIDGWTPIYAASNNGHKDVVQLLIQSGAAVDSRDNNGWTPLCAASNSGHRDVVQLLIQSGAAVDSPDNDGWTPLHAASNYGRRDVVQLLIQSGAAVDSCDNDGWTPLYAASNYGHKDVVQLLIQSGAAVDSRHNNGWTPLYAASSDGHRDIVQLLIRGGAAVDSRDNDGWTPLFAASSSDHEDVAQLLIQSGAAVDSDDDNGWTPLFIASSHGHQKVIQLLIQCRAEIDKQTNDGNTPLSQASAHGHLEIVRLLLENGSNPNTQDTAGWTPLHNAAHHGHPDIMKLLFKSGADLNVRNCDDETPPDVAAANGKWELAELLVEGVNVDSWDDWLAARLDSGSSRPPSVVVLPSLGHQERIMGCSDNQRTSMHMACIEGNLDAIRSLLFRDSSVNERDDNQETPLGVASRNGKMEVAKILVKNGADVNSRNKYGWTPLHHASLKGHFDIVRLLLDEGTDVNAKELNHQSALHIASVSGHFEIVQLLLERGANVDMRNKEGRTPCDLASRFGELKIVGLLSQTGDTR